MKYSRQRSVGSAGQTRRAYLSSDGDLRGVFEAEGALHTILIVEDDSDGCFRYTCLSPDQSSASFLSSIPTYRLYIRSIRLFARTCGLSASPMRDDRADTPIACW